MWAEGTVWFVSKGEGYTPAERGGGGYRVWEITGCGPDPLNDPRLWDLRAHIVEWPPQTDAANASLHWQRARIHLGSRAIALSWPGIWQLPLTHFWGHTDTARIIEARIQDGEFS